MSARCAMRCPYWRGLELTGRARWLANASVHRLARPQLVFTTGERLNLPAAGIQNRTEPSCHQQERSVNQTPATMMYLSTAESSLAKTILLPVKWADASWKCFRSSEVVQRTDKINGPRFDPLDSTCLASKTVGCCAESLISFVCSLGMQALRNSGTCDTMIHSARLRIGALKRSMSLLRAFTGSQYVSVRRFFYLTPHTA